MRVTEGETLVIDCPILGFPQPTIEWLKDNASIGKCFDLFYVGASWRLTSTRKTRLLLL
ncbi:unnamed protein product [Toxocara canis]|uniref:Ig-like domain-containing protein n=1 Tax=Toxocara canis TaxID=6265 RepID=A0A3P7GRB5_TOXCA|nr:unnamed protein product [Toxocara canis]